MEPKDDREEENSVQNCPLDTQQRQKRGEEKVVVSVRAGRCGDRVLCGRDRRGEGARFRGEFCVAKLD